MEFTQVKIEDIEAITDRLYRESTTVVNGRWVGAGRSFFARGTPGYIDNILPVNGVGVRQALNNAHKRNAGKRKVELWDVGCANGNALCQLLKTMHQYEGIDLVARGFTGNVLEFLKNPPVKDGRFEREGDSYNFHYAIEDKKADQESVEHCIKFKACDMHKLPIDSRPDVLMSVACVKYSHDPWRVFANMLRIVQPDGQVFIGHLLEGTGRRESRQPISDIEGNELSPKQYVQNFAKLNPGMTIVCNEDENRMVTDEKGKLVFNAQHFYANDKSLNSYREQLIEKREKAVSQEDKDKIDRDLLRVSPNGFFSTSIDKCGIDNLFFGLLYVGDQYGKKTQYLFVPDKAKFDEFVKNGYLPV